jgi:hypothetical protein
MHAGGAAAAALTAARNANHEGCNFCKTKLYFGIKIVYKILHQGRKCTQDDDHHVWWWLQVVEEEEEEEEEKEKEEVREYVCVQGGRAGGSGYQKYDVAFRNDAEAPVTVQAVRQYSGMPITASCMSITGMQLDPSVADALSGLAAGAAAMAVT